MARGRESRVHRDENELRIIAGRKASVSPDVTLENWFRKQARTWSSALFMTLRGDYTLFLADYSL